MMNKKSRRLLLCWLLVFCAAWLFSDREAQTYVFENEMLAAFVESREEADQAEKDAKDQMYLVQAEAARRTDSGLWGDDGISGKESAEIAKRAVDENGLNLMWGMYDIAITLEDDALFEGSIVCAGKQRLIRQGEISGTSDGSGQVHSRFTVTDTVENIRMATDMPERVSRVTVSRCGTTRVDPDRMAYMILLGAALTVLILLSEEKRPDNRERLGTAAMLMLLIVFTSAPVMWRGIYDGRGHDLLFHVNRIEGIASGLRAGQFPVRIHASTLQGYGYAASEFYPELFLYFPALLRNLGVTLDGALRIFMVAINTATVLSCYISMMGITGRRDAAVGITVLYATSIYRLVNLYTRSAYGEGLAMIFFPLLIWAMWEILAGDEGRWPLLALAMTGICASHLLSVLFCTLFCALAALLCLPELLRKKKRIGAIFLAAGVTAACFAGFLIPMLDYIREGINTNVALEPEEHTLTLGSFFIAFAGDRGKVMEGAEDYAYTIGVVPGLAIMAGMALFGVQRYREGKKAEEKMDRISGKLLLLGCIALLLTTDLFPWKFFRIHRPFSLVAGQMQFPWRMIGIAVPMLAVPAVWGALREEKWKKPAMAALMTISVLTSSYTMQAQVEDLPAIYQDSCTTTSIGQYEYLYVLTQKDALWPGDLRMRGLDPWEITAYEKNGTNLTFTVRSTPGEHSMVLPLLYYKGYEAEGEGCGSITLTRGNNNVLMLTAEDMTGESTFRVWFRTPLKWWIATAVSACSGILLLFLVVRDSRRCRRRN